MKYVLKPSLEQIALLKVGITLWNEKDIKIQLDKYRPSFREWDKIETIVADKIIKLPLPELLKKKILAFIKPIGKEIFKYMKKFFEDHPCANVPFDILGMPTVLCWTSHGTVDRKKTAELLIKNESIDIIERYNIACLNCLEDDIQKLWVKISEDRKESFHDENTPYCFATELVKFWTYHKNGCLYESSDLGCFSYQYRFECAAVHNDIVATKYFWQILPENEREESLNKFGKYITDAEVICYFLSRMDEEQQINLLRQLSCNMLQHFLDWPWQTFFLEIASRMPYCHDDYRSLLMYITTKSFLGYKDYKYENLYREFWLQPSDDFRKFIINDENAFPDLVQGLIDVKFIDNIKLVFKDTTSLQRNRLFFNEQCQFSCQELIYQDDWDLLDFFIQECISSRSEMLKLKEEFRTSTKVKSGAGWKRALFGFLGAFIGLIGAISYIKMTDF